MDDVDLRFGKARDQRLIGFDGALELVDGALADVEEKRNQAHAFRQETDQFFDAAGPHGGLDATDDASPGRVSHDVLLM